MTGGNKVQEETQNKWRKRESMSGKYMKKGDDDGYVVSRKKRNRFIYKMFPF